MRAIEVGATDPNAALMSTNKEAIAILETAGRAFLDPDCPHVSSGTSEVDYGSAGGETDTCDTGGGPGPGNGFVEAWTSLRLSSAYQYPTHIDCFENMILQLHGDKVVYLLPPDAIPSVRPDPNHKHWPTAPPEELAAAARSMGRNVTLAPGDQLYVPVMWFHSVESPAWSVTANRYYRTAPSAVAAAAGDMSLRHWQGHIESKKTAVWRTYEAGAGMALC